MRNQLARAVTRPKRSATHSQCTHVRLNNSAEHHAGEALGPISRPGLPYQRVAPLRSSDLSSSQKPVTVLNPGSDPYALDRDKDGVGCEGG